MVRNIVLHKRHLHPDHDLMEGYVHPDMLDAFKLDTAPTFKSTDGKKQNPDKTAAFRSELAASSRNPTCCLRFLDLRVLRQSPGKN